MKIRKCFCEGSNNSSGTDCFWCGGRRFYDEDDKRTYFVESKPITVVDHEIIRNEVAAQYQQLIEEILLGFIESISKIKFNSPKREKTNLKSRICSFQVIVNKLFNNELSVFATLLDKDLLFKVNQLEKKLNKKLVHKKVSKKLTKQKPVILGYTSSGRKKISKKPS
jgi:hypothetical protein